MAIARFAFYAVLFWQNAMSIRLGYPNWLDSWTFSPNAMTDPGKLQSHDDQQAQDGSSPASVSREQIAREVARRRTFGIISHPDAGKTTLTEKLLLFSGAIQLAGTVKARKSGRHATSDWMEIEKQRGISVASSVMQFEYRDHVVNLLDTPGHQDFSEDTYRVLTAVDSALMVIDAAKGVEAQTIKLLNVCRMRNTPIITFMNKMDRETRDPLELLDELKQMHGESAPDKLLFQHFQKRFDHLAPVLDKVPAPGAKAAKLAALREKQGCASHCECEPGQPLRIVELHNPLQRIFERYPRAAAMELRMLEQLFGTRVLRREIPTGRETPPHVVFEIL